MPITYSHCSFELSLLSTEVVAVCGRIAAKLYGELGGVLPPGLQDVLDAVRR